MATTMNKEFKISDAFFSVLGGMLLFGTTAYFLSKEDKSIAFVSSLFGAGVGYAIYGYSLAKRVKGKEQ